MQRSAPHHASADSRASDVLALSSSSSLSSVFSSRFPSTPPYNQRQHRRRTSFLDSERSQARIIGFTIRRGFLLLNRLHFSSSANPFSRRKRTFHPSYNNNNNTGFTFCEAAQSIARLGNIFTLFDAFFRLFFSAASKTYRKYSKNCYKKLLWSIDFEWLPIIIIKTVFSRKRRLLCRSLYARQLFSIQQIVRFVSVLWSTCFSIRFLKYIENISDIFNEFAKIL